MRLKEEDIKEFQKIYYMKFGKEITADLAYDQGMALLTLLKTIYKPIPKDYFTSHKNNVE